MPRAATSVATRTRTSPFFIEVECLLACVLRFVAVKRIRLDACATKFASKVLSAVFGAAEDKAEFVILRAILVLFNEIKK